MLSYNYKSSDSVSGGKKWLIEIVNIAIDSVACKVQLFGGSNIGNFFFINWAILILSYDMAQRSSMTNTQ